MTRSAHLDTFARDHLPPREQWPEFLFERPELQFPERLNCAGNLLDRWVESGQGERLCVQGAGIRWSYFVILPLVIAALLVIRALPGKPMPVVSEPEPVTPHG